MKKLLKRVASNRRKLPLAVWMLLGMFITVGLWLGVDRSKPPSASQAGGSGKSDGRSSNSGGVQAGGNNGGGGDGVDRVKTSDGHRPPLQVWADGKQTVEERVRQLQGMRGLSLSKEERESAISFLAGKEVPDGMGKASLQWLADELLTVMRVQEPPQENLAEDLGKVAFQPGTDPVVRDYIMQHLGHLWEQSGPREEIEKTLWQALETSDETTPGTALLALSRGYERDKREDGLAKVRQQALTLAEDPNTTLAVRVTALTIAGDGGGTEVKRLAGELAANPETPVILRKVAERAVR